MSPLLLSSMMLSASAALPYTMQVEAGRLSHGAISGVVDIPVDQALSAVMDCDSVDNWFPDMTDTVVVHVQDGVTRCAGATDLPWPVQDRTWEVDTAAHLELVDGVETWVARFDYVDGTGNLDLLKGQYRLQRAPDGGTLVTYEAWVDLGFWVPGPLVTWATRRVLPGILSGLASQRRALTVAANH